MRPSTKRVGTSLGSTSHVACETWRDNVEKATAFTERNPERCLTVVHGRLVADPAEIYTAIFEFLRRAV